MPGALRFGNSDVSIQDQHSEIVGGRFSKVKNTSTLTSDTAVNDIQINISDATAFIAGDRVRINQDKHTYLGKVLSKSNNTLQLDSPLDHVFPSGTVVSEIEENLVNSIAGTRAAPDVFEFNAPAGVEFDITEIDILIEGTSTKPDTSKFGSVAGLTNGMVLRICNAETLNITNVKTNLDMERFGKVEFSDKGAGGNYLLKATYDLRAIFGVVFRIGSQTIGDKNPIHLELLVQDSLAGNTSINVVAKGHVVI